MKSDAVSVLRAPSCTRHTRLPLGFGFSKKPHQPHGKSQSCRPGWGRGQQQCVTFKNARIKAYIWHSQSQPLGCDPRSKCSLGPGWGSCCFCFNLCLQAVWVLRFWWMDLNAIIQVYVQVVGIHVCIFWMKQEGGKKKQNLWKHLSERLLWYLQLVSKMIFFFYW